MKNIETAQIIEQFSLESDTKELIQKSLNSFSQLWVKTQYTYLRSSDQLGEINEKAYFPTATLSSFDVLVRLLLFYPDWIKNEDKETIINNFLTLFENTKNKLEQSALNDDKKEINCYTYSRFVRILAFVSNHCKENSSQIYLKSKKAINSEIEDYLNIVEKNGEKLHPFIIFHVFRTLIELHNIAEISKDIMSRIDSIIINLQEETRKYSHDLIADHKISNSNPSNSLALGFCAAILNLKKSESDKKYLLPALEICFQEQIVDGCWPQGRILNQKDSIDTNLMEFTTYEVSWVLCDLMVDLEKERNSIVFSKEFDLLIQKIFRAGFYTLNSIQTTNMNGNNIAGWCSNSHFNHETVESWTTAYALHFLLSLFELKELVERRLYLEDFTVQFPNEKNWPKWCNWDSYIENNEPDNKILIFKYINDNIVQPILDDPRKLPNTDKRNISLILFGPPGTQKTTIAKVIASKLDWPIVYLDPGSFIENGIEMIASQTNLIFKKLNKLTRVVLLFDEFDELIRKRSDDINQSTTLNSLITSTLLPKFDFLHNSNSLIFIICTNHIKNIDPAILRGGRIDHKIGIPPPDETTRKKILQEILDKNFQNITESQKTRRDQLLLYLDLLSIKTNQFTRKDLQKLCQDIIVYKNDEITELKLDIIIKNQEKYISISDLEMKEFIEARILHSHPDQIND